MNRVETFTAWRQSADSAGPCSIALDIGNPADLADALTIATAHCFRKNTLSILASNALTAKATLRIYAITESPKPRWQPGGMPYQGGQMKAKLLHQVEVHSYDPVEPWMTTSKPDRVFGNDSHLRQIIEGQAHA